MEWRWRHTKYEQFIYLQLILSGYVFVAIMADLSSACVSLCGIVVESGWHSHDPKYNSMRWIHIYI